MATKGATYNANCIKVEAPNHERKDMKLVEICATRIEQWRDEWMDIQQTSSGHLISLCHKAYGERLFAAKVAEDQRDAVVTRAQWEAERARILAESQPERDPEIAEIGEKAFCKRSKEDQALWDKVAIEQMKFYHQVARCDFGDALEFGCDEADEFMEERAKRMKG